MIKAIAATKNEFHHSCLDELFQFDDNVLSRLAETAPGNFIIMDFKYKEGCCGKIIKAEVIDEQLVVEIEPFLGFSDSFKGRYVVPGYIEETFEAIDFGLTDKPCDKTLPAIQ